MKNSNKKIQFAIEMAMAKAGEALAMFYINKNASEYISPYLDNVHELTPEEYITFKSFIYFASVSDVRDMINKANGNVNKQTKKSTKKNGK